MLPWIGFALAAVAAFIGCWVAYQLVRQNGRILVRLEAIEQQLATWAAAPPKPVAAPAGLAIGSPAPPFELDDLSGRRRPLADFRGRRVLVVFFDPSCGFCVQMAADLAALSPDGKDSAPIPVVVTTGDAEANRRFVNEHGIRCAVLLQKQREVAEAYQVSGTPIGYLVDERGRIASEIAVGALALLALVRPQGLVGIGEPRAHANGANGVPKGDPSLAKSRINRDGLAAGTPAPSFRLPRLDGGELSLEDYRGRGVLLVFSDPQCAPCMELATELERVARGAPEPAIVIISRGDPEANRTKVAALGITLPVVLQRQWEISLAYGMFATPIGYLIDAAGVIASDVAMGKDQILALHSAVLTGRRTA